MRSLTRVVRDIRRGATQSFCVGVSCCPERMTVTWCRRRVGAMFALSHSTLIVRRSDPRPPRPDNRCSSTLCEAPGWLMLTLSEQRSSIIRVRCVSLLWRRHQARSAPTYQHRSPARASLEEADGLFRGLHRIHRVRCLPQTAPRTMLRACKAHGRRLMCTCESRSRLLRAT